MERSYPDMDYEGFEALLTAKRGSWRGLQWKQLSATEWESLGVKLVANANNEETHWHWECAWLPQGECHYHNPDALLDELLSRAERVVPLGQEFLSRVVPAPFTQVAEDCLVEYENEFDATDFPESLYDRYLTSFRTGQQHV